MNIVFVSKEFPPSPRAYGIGTYVYECASGFAKMGHKVTVIAAADPGELAGQSEQDGATVIRVADRETLQQSHLLQRTNIRPALQYRMQVADVLHRLIAEGQADVVEFAGFRGESQFWTRSVRRVPMIVRVHGPTGWMGSIGPDILNPVRLSVRYWEHCELLTADHVTLVAEHLRQSVETRRRHALTVVPNALDVTRWQKSVWNTDEVTAADILFVGSLIAAKGIFVLLEAASQLREGGWRGQLVIAGRSGRHFDAYTRKRWGAAGLPPWVRLLGQRKRFSLAPLYRSAGVCCFPSTNEPFGYTCLEAMASGGLVVGTSGAGMAETLDQTSGFLVPPGNISALRDALRHALSLPAPDRAELSDRAFTRALRFDIRYVLPEMLAIYEKAALGFDPRVPEARAAVEQCY